jgi:hypothetical protein
MAEFSFNDLVQNIAQNKKMSAEHRFSKQVVDEKPRDVYLTACKRIASYYEPFGFKYSKSSQHLRLIQKDSEFVFQISFGSSHYNVAGVNVEIKVYASVISQKFKKWQSENINGELNSNPNEYICGGLIGNLQENTIFMKWNIGNKATREQEIENIIENINCLAIPYFEKFSNVQNLVAEIEQRGDYWGFIYMSSIAKFILYVSTKETLERTLSNFLTKRKTWEKYHKALSDLENKIQLDGTYWSQIAKLTKDLNLKLNEE